MRSGAVEHRDALDVVGHGEQVDGPQPGERIAGRTIVKSGVKPGEHVFLRAREWGQRKGEGAVFQAGIASGEAIELIADGLRGFGIDNLQLSHSRPAKFGLLPGFAFDFQFDSRRGLRYSGFGAGELENDTLSFIVFFAPTEYYFERDRGNAQKTLDSIRNH